MQVFVGIKHSPLLFAIQKLNQNTEMWSSLPVIRLLAEPRKELPPDNLYKSRRSATVKCRIEKVVKIKTIRKE